MDLCEVDKWEDRQMKRDLRGIEKIISFYKIPHSNQYKSMKHSLLSPSQLSTSSRISSHLIWYHPIFSGRDKYPKIPQLLKLNFISYMCNYQCQYQYLIPNITHICYIQTTNPLPISTFIKSKPNPTSKFLSNSLLTISIPIPISIANDLLYYSPHPNLFTHTSSTRKKWKSFLRI